MSNIKKVIVFLLSLIIAFDIFIIVASLLTKNRILNVSYYQKKCEQNNFYLHLSNNINNRVNAIVQENNLDRDVFKGLVDEKFVEDNINRIIIQTVDFFLKIENTLPNANLSLDREIIKIEEDYLNKNNIPITGEIKKEIDQIANNVNKTVENYILPVNLEGIQNKYYIQQIRDVLNNLYRNLNKYIVILLIAVGLLLVINKFAAFKTLAIILEVVGVTLAAPFYTIYFMKILSGSAIGDKVLMATLVSVVNGYVLYIANFGFVFLILGFIIYVLYLRFE